MLFQIFEGYVEGEAIAEVQEAPLESAGIDNDVASNDLPADQQQQLITSTLPVIESLTIESRTFAQQLGPVPVEPSQPQQQHIPPTDQTMPPVEPIFYQQVTSQPPQIQPQPQQPPRPITEMLGTGSFFFLQVKRNKLTSPLCTRIL